MKWAALSTVLTKTLFETNVAYMTGTSYAERLNTRKARKTVRYNFISKDRLGKSTNKLAFKVENFKLVVIAKVPLSVPQLQ